MHVWLVKQESMLKNEVKTDLLILVKITKQVLNKKKKDEKNLSTEFYRFRK